MIIDTHAHYDDNAYDLDRDALLKSFPDNNIELIVNASANLNECKATLELLDKYPFIYGMLGIHPSEVCELNDNNFKWLRDACIDNAIYNNGKIVAVGEIGLDYYYPDPPKEIQIKWFKKQIELAHEVDLPINIHSRDAALETYNILKEYQSLNLSGIIHCYSYSKEMAKDFLSLGFSFGIGGVVTFKNAKKLVEAVEYLPLDAIVLETDAPYLSPTPFRGERNSSLNIIYIAQKIAEIKNVSYEEVLKITNNNAKRIYRINANT